MHGVYDHARPAVGLAMAPRTVLPSPLTHRVGVSKVALAAQYPAHVSPLRRFADTLADIDARSGADVVGYTFIVRLCHPLRLASLLAHGPFNSRLFASPDALAIRQIRNRGLRGEMEFQHRRTRSRLHDRPQGRSRPGKRKLNCPWAPGACDRFIQPNCGQQPSQHRRLRERHNGSPGTRQLARPNMAAW